MMLPGTVIFAWALAHARAASPVGPGSYALSARANGKLRAHGHHASGDEHQNRKDTDAANKTAKKAVVAQHAAPAAQLQKGKEPTASNKTAAKATAAQHVAPAEHLPKMKEETVAKADEDASDDNATLVKVEIYYETLCPYCQNFITKSLAQAWKDEELRSHFEVHFYPYGNAQTLPKNNVSDGYRYWHTELAAPGFNYVFPCQHGPDECFGNHLQACAIKNLETQENYVPFIMCMEGNDTVSQEMSSFDCAKTLGIDLDPVRECVQGQEGNDLMYSIGAATESLAPPAGPKQYVPWITINGVHSDQSELDGEPGSSGHFLTELCAQIEDPQPKACLSVVKSGAAGTPRSLGLPLGLLAAALFLRGQ